MDAEEAMKRIENIKSPNSAACPTMYIQLLNHLKADQYDLSSLVTCIGGSAPMPLTVARQWKEKYGIDIWEGYGLSEATTVNSVAISPEKAWNTAPSAPVNARNTQNF